MLFSEPKIPQSIQSSGSSSGSKTFQCSSASRKFLNPDSRVVFKKLNNVSVLFSEPKIPQWYGSYDTLFGRDPFQCSSASRKFLNMAYDVDIRRQTEFQCSSASRKFLNRFFFGFLKPYTSVSVLFSEPKIPQFGALVLNRFGRVRVSVLFSEPKIPQCVSRRSLTSTVLNAFQCSSASRKFLNFARQAWTPTVHRCFSALQRAENSSMLLGASWCQSFSMFQCSSASRKFLNSPASPT